MKRIVLLVMVATILAPRSAIDALKLSRADVYATTSGETTGAVVSGVVSETGSVVLVEVVEDAAALSGTSGTVSMLLVNR